MAFRIVAVLAALVSAAGVTAAPVTTATPEHHGLLDILPARGTIDPQTGMAKLRVRGWRLQLEPTLGGVPGSDGIYPDQEPILIALAENNFYLPAGSVKASRGGKRFRYRAPRDAGPRAIRSLRLTLRQSGTYTIYAVSFTLTGIELSRLTLQDRDCVPMAFIVGDDDGFSGVRLRRPNLDSRRLLVPGFCDASGTWPWIQ